VSGTRQAVAVNFVGNPQPAPDLQAAGSSNGQSSELSQLMAIMMSLVGHLDATVSRLDVTQGQVLRALVVNGNTGGATGVGDSHQTSQHVKVSCSLQKLVNSLDVTQGQSNNRVLK
jgi:hypothetical protein